MIKQYHFECGNPETRRIARELRKSGYRIVTSALGRQVTGAGTINTTMITIFNPDGREGAIIAGRDYMDQGI